ncbi:multiple sugar transport system permease protein [Microbacterium sp. W4I4]|uniref:carbohydrate ABC transporter permease n=1 Tax=Microbacterium sp. W4I4 TaxID=3042295 RepID=UPI00277FFDA3|nr:carbohydrate ABC transporter permease [Microbacterium sp. W4I4]MDQ0615015.1 multiple sugar transport system permease protein [Microbacterium sp. W4I4]
MSTEIIEAPTLIARAGYLRRKRKERAVWWLTGLIMAAIALLFLTPFLWMVSSSLKNNVDIFEIPLRWIPDPMVWANYINVWFGERSMVRYFSNSTIVVIATIIGQLIVVTLAGYAFGQLKFKGQNVLFLAFLATSMVPGQLLLVPRFMFFRQIGLYDTLWALILPGLASVFSTFLLRQHFASAPRELGEAARIDGASEWRIFFHIYLPLARPMLAALAILIFDATWNDYESALIMITDESKFTIPLGLTRFMSEDGTVSLGPALAGSVSSLIPVLIVFLIFQRQFMHSMSRAGLR